MPAVPIVILDSAGLAHRASFELDARQSVQVFTFRLTAAPREVRVDPDGALLLSAELRR